jgi:signal transduction histidine kinase/Fe-S-cluster-containing hydrogenase component 2
VLFASNTPLVTTIRERCRVCYTCVRECPAKAIRIADGQAEVLPERCIGCGNCVRVCSQNAKQVLNTVDQVEQMLAGPDPVAAIIAPSFPAEFTDTEYPALIGMLRRLGFEYVNEVAFGADLVADRYRRLLEGNEDRRYIATSCPGIVAYVERYHPTLVDRLAPIVSPMVAAARALKRLHGDQLKIVFIGPCIAKKCEAASVHLDREVDAGLTFVELRRMFDDRRITPGNTEPSDFDPPHAGVGAVFAISRGLLQAAHIREDLMTGEVVTADGRSSFPGAIKAFEVGNLDARLLEVLCCNGCIMGAGMSSDEPLFTRRSHVSQFARLRTATVSNERWKRDMASLEDLDLSRHYAPNDQRVAMPSREQVTAIMRRLGKEHPEDELNCGACGYDTCLEHAIAIHKGLAETEMCLPHTIEQMKTAMEELAQSNQELADTREQLIQSEKLASMGQLAAGIAHEVNNPLGIVLMYAHLLLEEHGGDEKVREDLQMIVDQASRCRKIVGGLLDFARQNKVLREPTDLKELVDQSVRALQKPAAVRLDIQHELDDPIAEVDRDQVIQVMTNLVSNAYAAMTNGGTLTVRTDGDAGRIRVAIEDTGTGIPADNMKKIFEPFFTTKQIGRGTGLGLAVTYGIVKMHHGDIAVQSNADPNAGPTGTSFIVTLPRRGGTS